MAKYKSYDYSQRVMIPISLDDQLVPGTLEFAIHTLVETRMDTSIFDVHYRNDEVGRSAYDPKVLLKIILFGYSRGLISSRQLEHACRENVIFKALACGQQPDHSTIAAFVSTMKDEILPLFREGSKIYPHRLAIVEPVFANITIQKRMYRFTLRSKIKVDIQWMLYCMVHNIGKILKYGPEYGVT